MKAVDFKWPGKPFHVALVEPEIPPNTGNIARLCAATGSPLHLIDPLGFRLTDRQLKRAGLDYWGSVEIIRHTSFESFEKDIAPARLVFFSAGSGRSYLSAEYQPGDVLVFGCESKGLPEEILKAKAENVFAIPVLRKKVRSLNLATAVGIVLYEALRQVQAGCTGISG